VKFPTFTPDVERRNPSSQREGFDMAADPRYRVFVIFVDLVFSSSAGAVAPQNDLSRIQQPLVGFLQRVLGPQDLFGFLTSRNTVVFVTNYLTRAQPNRGLLDANGGLLPRVGITQGRITSGERNPGAMANDSYCAGEGQRLAMMDFDARYRQLLQDARKENVS